jgi:hypothetical protein
MLRDRKSIEYFRLFIVGGLYKGFSIRVQHLRSQKITWRDQEKWEKHAAVDGDTNRTKWCLQKFNSCWLSGFIVVVCAFNALARVSTHTPRRPAQDADAKFENRHDNNTSAPMKFPFAWVVGLVCKLNIFRKKKSHHLEVSRLTRDNGAHTQCRPFESWKGWPGVGGNWFARFVGGCDRDQKEWEI